MELMMKKLHSRRGASILLAMLLFLVAAMVVSVVLSAAMTAARRVSDDRQREQDYLAVSSAAVFLKQALEDSRYSETTVRYYDEEWNPVDEPAPEDPPPVTEGLLHEVFSEAEVHCGDAGHSYTVRLRPAPVEDAELPGEIEFSFKIARDPDSSASSEHDFFTVNGTIRAKNGTGSSQVVSVDGMMHRSEQSVHDRIETEGGAEVNTLETTVVWTCDSLELSAAG
ncbi:MAG: hypothetical protein K5855_05320 [Oscillospiraceae bacterium]|nr:hypothetical protein [Oscillospiraceae bacterium]